MAKLQTFNGGLSTRGAEHLIGINSGIVYNNIDNETGELKPVKLEAVSGETLGQYAFYFEAESLWESTATDTDYLEYQRALYKADGVGIPQRQVAGVSVNMGILAEVTAPSVALGAAGVLTGTYQYVYTYYSSVTGAESAPSGISAEIVVTSDQIDLTSIVAATDTQVTNIRIYRVGGLNSIFALAATIASTATTYTDNIADTAIPGDDLVTESSGQALAGARDLKEAYGIIFYTLADKLYFSNVGEWYDWPATNFIDFDKDIKGYGLTSRGILVCTINRTYLITGTTPASFSRSNLSGSQGCKHYRSMVELGSALFWISEDGLCTSAGGVPIVVSRPALGKVNVQVTNAVVHDDVYYVQQIDGSLFAFDTRYGNMFKQLSLSTTRLVVALDILYGYFITEYKELFASDNSASLSYTSPRLLDGSYTKRKSYKSVYLRHDGSLTVVVYVGTVVAATINVTGEGTYELDVDQDLRDGYSIQFVINGTGILKELAYQATSGPRL